MAWNACTAPVVVFVIVVVVVVRRSVSASSSARGDVWNERAIRCSQTRQLNCWHLKRARATLGFLSLLTTVSSFSGLVVGTRELLLVGLRVVEISHLFGVGSHLWFLILASA